MTSSEHQILLAGFGGQGILFAGQVLAQAAMAEGKNVAWVPSYGPEMRGGTAHCVVFISSEPIGSLFLEEPTAAIIMNGPSLEKFQARLRPGGLLVVNTSLVKPGSLRTDLDILLLPATELALKAGSEKVATIVALGALLARQKLISVETVLQKLRDLLPLGREDLRRQNAQALRLGLKGGQGGDEKTEHVFQARQQVVGRQHDSWADFRAGQVGEWVADKHHTATLHYGLGHCTASPSSME